MIQTVTNSEPLISVAEVRSTRSPLDFMYFEPSRPETPEDQAAAKVKQGEENQWRGLSQELADLAPAAYDFYASSATAAWLRGGDITLAGFDPTFTLNDDLFKMVSAGVPEEWWPEFAKAGSEEGVWVVKRQLMERLEREQRMAKMGTTKRVGLGLVAGATDPLTIAAAAMSAGLGEAVGLAGLTGRLGAMTRTGVIAGLGNLGAEAVIQAERGGIQGRQAYESFATGMMLGGGLAGLFHSPKAEVARIADLNARLESLARRMEFDPIRELAEQDPFRVADDLVTDKGRAYFTEQLDPQAEMVKVYKTLAETDPLAEVTVPPLVLPVEQIPRMSVRQFKTSTPEGFAYTNQKGIGARLTNEGVIELGPKFFATTTSKTERLAMIRDAETGGALGAGGVDIILFDAARRIAAEEGKVSASRLAARIKGLDYEQAKALADRIRAVQAYEASRGLDPRASFFDQPARSDTGPRPALSTPISRTAEPALRIGPPPDGSAINGDLDRIYGMGAASKATIDTKPSRGGLAEPGDPNFETVSDSPGTKVFGWMPRMGMVGQLVDSKVPAVRKLARIFAEDVLPSADGQPVNMSASELVKREHNARMSRYFDAIWPHVTEWMQKNDPGILGRKAKLRELFETATRVGLGEHTDDPHVKAIAEVESKHYGELLAKAKRMKVKGFEGVEADPRYRPVRWLQWKIEEATNKWGGQAVEDLFTRAVLPLNDRFTPDLARRIARGMLKNIGKVGQETDVVRELALSGDKPELLRQVLHEAGVPEADIADIVYKITPKDAAKNTMGAAKYRTKLDHLTHLDVSAPDGTKGRLYLTDLMEMHSAELLHDYARQVEGAANMAETFRVMARSADDKIESLAALLERVRVEAREAGLTETQIGDEVGKLDVLARHVLGLRIHEAGDWDNFLITARKIQYARTMGLAVFSQIADVAGVISEAGFSSVVRQVPALGQLFKRAQDGQLSNELLRELVALTGIGTHADRYELLDRVRPNDAIGELGTGQLNKGLDTINQFQTKYSLMGPVIDFAQRASLMLGAQKWADIALSGKVPSEKRLAGMGLYAGDAAAICAEIRTHATKDGTRLNKLNLDRWNPEVRAKFVDSMDKWSRRVAQQNDIGQLSKWMTTEMGQTLIQFRTFNVAAYEKQTLYGLHMADVQTFVNWMNTMLIGSFAYLAREYLASIGSKDRDRRLRERLAAKQVFLAGFGRAGFMSIFPPFMDAASRSTGNGPMFNNVRSTGLENHPLWGNPTLDFLNQISSVPQAMLAPMKDNYRFSQQDFRSLRQLVPLQNMLGIRNVLDAFQTRLPSRSTLQYD